MMLLNNSIQKKLWPLLVAVSFFLVLSVPLSDTFPSALWLVAGFSGLCSLSCWLIGFGRLRIFGEKRVLELVIVATCFIFFLVGQPYLIEVFRCHDCAYGLYDRSRAGLEELKLCGIACTFILGVTLASRDDEAGRFSLDALTVCVATWGIACIFMFIKDPVGIYGIAKIGGVGRLTGTFSSANSAGTLFGAGALLAEGRIISYYFRGPRRNVVERISLVFLPCFVVSSAALVLTQSRAAISLTIIIAILQCIFLTWRKLSLKGALLLWGGCFVTFLIFLAAIFTVLSGRLHFFGADIQIREMIFTEHMHVVTKHMLFGTGLGSFDVQNQSLVNAENYWFISRIRAMHNVYLQWLEEAGLVGTFIVFCINLCVLRIIIKAARDRLSVRSRLVTVVFVYLLFLLHGLVDYGFQEPALEIFCALMLGEASGLSLRPASDRPLKAVSAGEK